MVLTRLRSTAFQSSAIIQRASFLRGDPLRFALTAHRTHLAFAHAYVRLQLMANYLRAIMPLETGVVARAFRLELSTYSLAARMRRLSWLVRRLVCTKLGRTVVS